ncbi:hypothetical protein EMIHUDRAFT_245421, partial [Emiliania huxleyi CCMP1516]|uniref:F5/8 type C domain-containing protein n=2 Tax=Emiliania huxleyi TaxID=2903 RepID=A0A0D3IXB4_EMIH1
MAQQQAPPAAQAPIVVVVDEVQITSDAMLVLVPGAQHVKDHTPCLSWTTVYDNAGAVTSYTLGQSDAKGAFLPRCRFGTHQQTSAILDGNHILNVLFNGAFWSRLLTALDAANFFATSMGKIGVLHQRLADLAMANPGVWMITHPDIFLGWNPISMASTNSTNHPVLVGEPTVALAGRGGGRFRMKTGCEKSAWSYMMEGLDPSGANQLAYATSEYGGDWAEEEAVGPPSHNEGDCATLKAGSWAPARRDQGTYQLTVSFASPVRVAEVAVREHANPREAAGFLQRVEAWTQAEAGRGGWAVAWEGDDDTACGFDKVISLLAPTALTSRIRLTSRTDSAAWEYVDAVRVVGCAGEALGACDCASDGVSGGVRTSRLGCAVHDGNGARFCYVVDPSSCGSDASSTLFRGAGPCDLEVTQYAAEAYATSEYGGDWAEEEAVGPPSHNEGDCATLKAGSWAPARRDQGTYQLTVSFASPVRVAEVAVREHANPREAAGFLQRVEAWTQAEAGRGGWAVAWEGDDDTACGFDKVISLLAPTALTSRIRLTSRTDSAAWEYVDAVRVVGCAGEALGACDCASDGVSGGVRTSRLGCAVHHGNGVRFCYVVDPSSCGSDASSTLFRGAGPCDLEVTQYAAEAYATSEYGGDWAEEEAVGPPSHNEGDCATLKAGSWAPARRDQGTYQLTVSFASPVRVAEVAVREHANPREAAGFLQRVEAWTQAEAGRGGWAVAWEGDDDTACGFDKVISLLAPTALTSRIRLTSRTDSAAWEYVDAVRVVGCAGEALGACDCASDGVSGGVRTSRLGCAVHDGNGARFCYVVDPSSCGSDASSTLFRGAGPCDLEVTQYAAEAYATSEYGGDWAEEEAVGPPSHNEGDCATLKAGSWAPARRDQGTYQLTVSFASPVRVAEVAVREHANPREAAGFLQRVEAWTQAEAGRGGWAVAWEGDDDTACGFDKVISLLAPTALTSRIRLTSRTDSAAWEYVDAVRVVGCAGEALGACDCASDGVSGGVRTSRLGCAVHDGNRERFCYVVDPSSCGSDASSTLFRGAGPCDLEVTQYAAEAYATSEYGGDWAEEEAVGPPSHNEGDCATLKAGSWAPARRDQGTYQLTVSFASPVRVAE